MAESASSKIDWSVHDGHPENTCKCQCGTIYRSHAKFSFATGTPMLVSRKPCPGCGQTDNNLLSSSSDPEVQRI